MDSRIFHRLVAGAILWIIIASALQAQPKNILYLRFEQKHISRALPIAPDSVFSVFYRLSCKKPCDFHGIQIDFAYDKTIFAPIDKGLITVGSATANAEFAFSGVSAKDGTNSIAILGSQMFDTSNHLLFRYRATVLTSASIDSAAIAIFLIDTGVNSGIDSIVVENTGGKDNVGYFPFAVAYLDSVESVVHQKHHITLSSDSLAIKSDSVKSLSIQIDSIPAVNIQNAIFSAHIDTNLIEVLSVEKGAILASSTAETQIIADSFLIGFSGPRIITSGELLKLKIKAKHRTDTVTTRFIDPKLLITNADDSIADVAYNLRSITILGQADSTVDTTHSSVPVYGNSPEPEILVEREGALLIVRNLSITTEKVSIYSITGALLAQATVFDRAAKIPIELPRGAFVIASEGEAPKEYKALIYIVH